MDCTVSLAILWTNRAVDKRKYLMIIFLISLKPYVVTPHLNRLIETVQMRGHNIRFYAKLTKNFSYYHQNFTPSYLELWTKYGRTVIISSLV